MLAITDTVNDTASHKKYCQTDRHEGRDPTQPFDVKPGTFTRSLHCRNQKDIKLHTLFEYEKVTLL